MSLRIMGVINVTPDSFSDGGQFLTVDAAVARAEQLIQDGADILDIGGESTRPGSEPVTEEEELARVVPVLRALPRAVPISIDTTKPSIARAALDLGATILNDVNGFQDGRMLAVAAEYKPTVCIMHMQGAPNTMQVAPMYQDVVDEIESFLLNQASHLQALGIPLEQIWIDPGLGFGKTTAHNLQILASTARLASHGYPLLVGASRKAFIGRVLGGESSPLPTTDRAEGTLAVQQWAHLNGARIIRTHDVRGATRVRAVTQAILDAR